ncbi:MAG: hypothetical protein AB1445_15965 [Bacillota bacterium]
MDVAVACTNLQKRFVRKQVAQNSWSRWVGGFARRRDRCRPLDRGGERREPANSRR